MSTKTPSLTTLDEDVLYTIFIELNYVLRFDVEIMVIRPALLQLSSTCKRLRGLIAPSIFRRVTNLKRSVYKVKKCPGNDFWPPSIWKYIKIIDFYKCRPSGSSTFVTFAHIIPQLPYLRQVRFRMDQSPPEVLLCATATAGINSLEFTDIRLDGPPLTNIFLGLNLTNFTLTVAMPRPRNLNVSAELNQVAGVLSSLSRTLVYLKLSGDLLSFETLARLEWPCLCTLTLIDRVPYRKDIPLPIVISHMPRLHNLHYNFGATSESHIPPIVYWHESLGSPTLAATHPHLVSLSMSNIDPTEYTLDRLPEGLRSLRILALRERGQQELRGPRYPFSPLREADAFRIVAKAALLPDLIDLALTLRDLPSPALIAAVAKSCPGLRFLELSQSDFERHHAESPYSIDSLAEPLTQLRSLRELRISIGFGSQCIGSFFWGRGDKTLLYRNMDAAANILAERLTCLNVLAFSFANDHFYGDFSEYLVWYRYGIVSGVAGQPPSAKWDMGFPFEVSSEPDSRICGFT